MTHLDHVVLMMLWVGLICLAALVAGTGVWLYEAYRRWRYRRLARQFGCAVPRSKLKWM